MTYIQLCFSSVFHSEKNSVFGSILTGRETVQKTLLFYRWVFRDTCTLLKFFFLYETCLFQKSNLNQRCCLVLSIMSDSVHWNMCIHTDIYMCVYKKPRLNYLYLCFPLFLLSSKLESIQIHNIWSFVTIISPFKVFKPSFGKGKCLV